MNEPTKDAITCGAVMAMILSFAKNGSIVWMMIHGFLSWLYVIYSACTR